MRPHQKWRRKRFRHQKGRCLYCGCAMMLEGAPERQSNRCTLDHMMPLSRGGVDHWDNVVACCNTCNGRKGDMTVEEFARMVRGFHPLRDLRTPLSHYLASSRP